ncbi:cobalamin biosynthesis protein CobW [Marinomonas algicola]|uniref:cobalamin biosynthesis protein CobW n=1 Tax=Marinomonas algicola TaxID=2773454 RepID=UPI00174853AF|nr:cobalamin biosynthesis protein CobW [Marinomonas algicola]
MQLNKIPTTIVTGFLGSGKTTLLSNVLKQAAGKRIAVIVNEFGELDIDSELLRSCPLDCEEGSETRSEDGFYELANGCICCTVEEEFLPVMKQLVARRGDIDHILIETSGLALPKPLVQAFNWPGIKEYCTVDAVITVIDGPAVAAGRFAHDADKVQAQRLADESLDHDPSLQELLDDQLSAADLVVVSKTDLLSELEKNKVAKIVAHKVPAKVKTAYIDHGLAPLDRLLGMESATEVHINHIHNHHDHHHAHGAEHDHAHDHFDSFVVSLGEVDSNALNTVLNTLVTENNIYRVKGFAAVAGKPMRQVFQVVGERLERHFDRLWAPAEERKTQLVFIGKGLNKAKIEKALDTSSVN